MKTFAEWIASHKALASFLVIGDEVDNGFVEYFKNSSLPDNDSKLLIQQSEAADLCRNQEQKYLPTYATLKQENGKGFYAGNCYQGEKTPAIHHIFMTFAAEIPSFGYKYYRNCDSPALWYLRDARNHWHIADSNGVAQGPLKNELVLHILDTSGKEIEQITTTDNEA